MEADNNKKGKNTEDQAHGLNINMTPDINAQLPAKDSQSPCEVIVQGPSSASAQNRGATPNVKTEAAEMENAVKPKLQITFSTFTIKNGEVLKVEIPVVGHPAPKIEWQKNGQAVKETSSAHKRYTELLSNADLSKDLSNTRVPMEKIHTLPELKSNPFRKRICQVFSTSNPNDGSLSFEDFLDLLSAFSDSATMEIKSHYAFRIFDFDDDGTLDCGDLKNLVNCLTGETTDTQLTEDEMKQLIKNVSSLGLSLMLRGTLMCVVATLVNDKT
ncbi:hypothetical protein fugu_011824 [Takifugu bimaculatus]|uniref:EF-hand domain-containing protein n=1 Tax=Takifugu bimaculatus TaxID=433685 RepID=A0A4Z2C8U4_9TELE|nr:hypothetical protein fugu_011824 [Takifugu bimaculatus]